MTTLKKAHLPLGQSHMACRHVVDGRVYWLQTRLGEGRREIRIEFYPSASHLNGEEGA
jgi:hypothetical protein